MLTKTQKATLRRRLKAHVKYANLALLDLQPKLDEFLLEAERRGVRKGEEEIRLLKKQHEQTVARYAKMASDAVDGTSMQKLVDVCMQIGLTASDSVQGRFFKGKSIEQRAQWVVEQLHACGFETQPCGANWAKLKVKP